MCQKVTYPTRAEARRDAEIIRRGQARSRHRWSPAAANRKMRVYQCPRCRLYHLTSQPKRKR